MSTETKQQLKQQLAQYLDGQPESMQSFHRWMRRLEIAGVALMVVAFSAALYISITSKGMAPAAIAIPWFIFALSFTPVMLLAGIHTIVLKAFPSAILSGDTQKFVTGGGAVGRGWAFVLGSLIFAAFWGLLAYATGTSNLALLEPVIRFFGALAGVGIAATMLVAMYRQITKTR